MRWLPHNWTQTMATPLAAKAGSLLLRRKALRDSKGRFRTKTAAEEDRLFRTSSLLEATGLAARGMGDHSNCGKKQYKSAVCKAKAIRARAEQTGKVSVFQEPYLQMLRDKGL